MNQITPTEQGQTAGFLGRMAGQAGRSSEQAELFIAEQ
jgi:hypothetical protein